MSKISLPDFFRYYEHGNVHQMEAVAMLESSMPSSLLLDDSAWVIKYRTKPEEPPKPETSNPLDVVYDCQLDNPSGDGWRECFSSSCAMEI